MSAASSAHPLWQNKSTKVLYRALCDHAGKADVRVYFEDLYEKAAPARLLHKDFLSKFPNEVPQLWWEMFFANWLLHQPLLPRLTSPKSGPDFSAEFGENKIWIECTAPWPKNHARRIDSTQRRGVGAISPDDYLLAITAAMKEKIRQLSSLAVAPADIRLVAINLGTGSDVDLFVWDDPPLLFQALLGVGPTAHQIPVSNGEADTSQIRAVSTFKETANSAKGSPIGLRGFLDGSLSTVSGAFFSSHRYMGCPKPDECQFDFLHNPTAAVPCPRKLFRNVREYEVASGLVKEVSEVTIVGPGFAQESYGNLLSEIKTRVRMARFSAMQKVNTELIMLYWDLGKVIFEAQTKQGWGQGLKSHKYRFSRPLCRRPVVGSFTRDFLSRKRKVFGLTI